MGSFINYNEATKLKNNDVETHFDESVFLMNNSDIKSCKVYDIRKFRPHQNVNKIEKNKKDSEILETELKKYEEEIETLENDNQKYEKELDIYKYKNLVNAINTMNHFYENEQKNNKILEEIKMTKEQINQLKLKEHVTKYIEENKDDVEEIIKKDNKNEVKRN